MKNFPNLALVNHPLLKDKMMRLRDKRTQPSDFRRLIKEISALMTYEACSHFEITIGTIESPFELAKAEMLKRGIVVVPILRAGLGMIDGIISVIPEASIGMLGLYRNEDTLKPVDYYRKLPDNLLEKEVILVDPMLATGGSASVAADTLKKEGAKHLTMMSILAAPEGVKLMQKDHPDITIYTAALDRELNEKGYILPGLGDAGDRCFGT